MDIESNYCIANHMDSAIGKGRSVVADSGPELSPADGALLGGLLVGLGAVHAHAHVPAGGEDHVGGVGEAHCALLPTVALEQVVRPVDFLQVEGQAAPLRRGWLTCSVCDFRL